MRPPKRRRRPAGNGPASNKQHDQEVDSPKHSPNDLLVVTHDEVDTPTRLRRMLRGAR